MFPIIVAGAPSAADCLATVSPLAVEAALHAIFGRRHVVTVGGANPQLTRATSTGSSSTLGTFGHPPASETSAASHIELPPPPPKRPRRASPPLRPTPELHGSDPVGAWGGWAVSHPVPPPQGHTTLGRGRASCPVLAVLIHVEPPGQPGRMATLADTGLGYRRLPVAQVGAAAVGDVVVLRGGGVVAAEPATESSAYRRRLEELWGWVRRPEGVPRLRRLRTLPPVGAVLHLCPVRVQGGHVTDEEGCAVPMPPLDAPPSPCQLRFVRVAAGGSLSAIPGWTEAVPWRQYDSVEELSRAWQRNGDELTLVGASIRRLAFHVRLGARQGEVQVQGGRFSFREDDAPVDRRRLAEALLQLVCVACGRQVLRRTDAVPEECPCGFNPRAGAGRAQCLALAPMQVELGAGAGKLALDAAADRTVTAELLGLHQLDTGPECRAAVADALVRLTEPRSYDAKLIAEVRTCPDGIIVREKRFKLAALAPAAPR